MPSYDASTLTKIAALRTLVSNGTTPQAFELVKIHWPTPTGEKFYSVLDLLDGNTCDPAPPIDEIDVRLVPDSNPDWFLPINQDSSIGDEEVDLKFWDGDGEVADLLILHGEGIKVEFFYWFPQVELMLSIWEAHLRTEDEADSKTSPVKAAQGFRSAEGVLPRRAHFSACQAIFGGILNSTEEQAAHPECNYDLHLGGSIGTLDPDTSEPWTFCPRQTTADCVERGVDPLRHLSHQTILSTVISTQSSGGPLFSTSAGNETNLKLAVPVVMGERRCYERPALSFIRHPVTSNPDHGFFEAIYEMSEGPIEGYQDPYFTVGGRRQARDPIHFGENHGNLGQVAISLPVTSHGYSGTALTRYNFGWINPANVDQNDARADAIIRGLRDIRVYIEAGAGLVADYYGTAEFTDFITRRIDADINYVLQSGSPAPGVPPTHFSVRRVGYITFPETGEFEITCIHDDSARVVIDDEEIIDNINVGTDFGTFDAIADTPYTIIVEHVQGNAAGNHPWQMQLYWSSGEALVEEDTIPASAFTHDATYLLQRTSNRAWQIARMLTDNRWGYGYDYDRLSIESFTEAAEWVDEYVRFTDPLGNDWEHVRGKSDVDLQEKKIQQQIEDMCLAGRLSRPFLFNNQIHIVPLRALTEDELNAAFVFTDEGDDPNIIWDEPNKSTLRWSRTSAIDLKNRVECTYDSAANNYLETPAPPVEDEPAQLAAGRVVGDFTKKVETLKESLLGVTNEAHAVKLSWAFLDLGKFDEGGLQNNLRVKFKAWFMDTLEIHPFKVIKVVNTRLNSKYGFEYFRIMKMQRNGDLTYDIEAQAYNVEYMDSFETVIDAPPPGGGGGGGGGGCELQFGTVTFENGTLNVPIEPCE